MFNMTRIGKAIARLRREHDMTQVALADRMGVSCQAVSLWETGKSMPDIAKLPELAAIFGISIDELLGESAPAVTHAIDGDLPARTADGTISAKDLTDAAPLLPPSQISEAIQHLADRTSIASLLPFLDTSTVDEMMQTQAQKGQSIAMFLPFASENAIDALMLEQAQSGQDVSVYLPFASEETISKAALIRLRQKHSIDEFFPFLPDDFLSDLAKAVINL